MARRALKPVNRAAVAVESMLTLSLGQQPQLLASILAFSPTTDVEARTRGPKDVRMSSCELRLVFDSSHMAYTRYGLCHCLHWVL